MDWIRHYLELAVVGVVSALFTSLLARKRFVSERWWERKADAYTRILDALVDLHRYHEAYYEDLTNEAPLSEERKAELTAAWKTAWREVDNAIRLGAFVISPDAHVALTKMRTAKDSVDAGDFFGVVDAAFAATEACVKEIREVGRRDLQVGGRQSAWSRLRCFDRSARRAKGVDSRTS